MTRRPRWPWLLLVGALGLLAPGAAKAQADTPQISLQVDADVVGVGDIVHLQMTVQSSEGPPSDPELGASPGFVQRGRNSSPSQTHVSINGNRMDRYGLTVDFALQAQKVGTFLVGPLSFTVGGQRYQAKGTTVRVVPAGQAPPRRSPQQPQNPFAPFGFSPFDPWKNLFPGQDAPEEPPPPSVTTDAKLALEAPRAPLYFLHAAVDKPQAVVGEQVVFSVTEYLDVSATSGIEVDDSDIHEATAEDFVKQPLLRDGQDTQLVGHASIGGHTWRVVLLRRWALFPLHPGDLVIDPMRVSVVRPRAAAGPRATETITVHVGEPPAAGRPPGYALGDVGHFSLVGQVTPREIEQGGAVGVHVELSGTGNLPGSLPTPARDGVEWLAPEVHEQLGSIGHETFGGRRTFDYVVRVRKAGDVDLGDVTVPFWNADARKYEIARATLGTVTVKPSTSGATAQAQAAEQQPLQGLPGARDVLEGERTSRRHWADAPAFWFAGVGLWPLALGVAVAGRGAARRMASVWRARKASPVVELRDRMASARAACAGSDPRAADAAIARALQAATLVHARVTVLGAVGEELVERLRGAGVNEAAARELASILREGEAARFAPDASDMAAARARWDRAEAVIPRLRRER